MKEIRKTKLKQILDKRNISQVQLFELIKEKSITYIGKDVISNIVNGKKNNYEIYTLLKICVALNITPNELIDKDDFINTQLK